LAARSGHYDVCQLLLSRGADVDVNAKNRTCCTPLVVAAQLGTAKVCKLLIDHGAIVDYEIEKGLSTVFASFVSSAAKDEEMGRTMTFISNDADILHRGLAKSLKGELNIL
jgi:ankyrin repeat protein